MSFLYNNNKNLFKEFEKLLDPIYSNFYKFIYCIVRNNQVTEDVVQETIFIAMKSFATLRDKIKFKSWLFTIGKNETFKNLKRNQREIYVEDNVLELIAVTECEPSKVILTEEEKNEVINAINCLNENYKDIIILRYYAELSLEEISIILNKNYNTIRSQHKRAKQILFKELKETYWREEI